MKSLLLIRQVFEGFLRTPQVVATFGGGEATSPNPGAFGPTAIRLGCGARTLGRESARCAPGVRTDYILRGGDRLGVSTPYTAEPSASALIYVAPIGDHRMIRRGN